MYHSGLDYFTPDPGGEPYTKFCRVCGQLLEVEKNINGPTSWAESMGKMKHLHDRWKCPIAKEKWHQDAADLLMRAMGETSPSLKALLEKDAKEIVERGRSE